MTSLLEKLLKQHYSSTQNIKDNMAVRLLTEQRPQYIIPALCANGRDRKGTEEDSNKKTEMFCLKIAARQHHSQLRRDGF